jgi:hypothetical protein
MNTTGVKTRADQSEGSDQPTVRMATYDGTIGPVWEDNESPDAFVDDDEDELRDFDPAQEGGGGPCAGCGREMPPWRYSSICQGCAWDERGAR